MTDILIHFFLNYAEEEYLEIYPKEKEHIEQFIKWLHERLKGSLKEGGG